MSVLLYSPALASLHDADPVVDHFPSSHALQLEDPDEEYSPHAQSEQSSMES